MCSDTSADPLADLERALDRVAGQDLKGMFGPQVLERARRLLTVKNRLEAQLARTVREGELTQASEHDEAKTMQAWLRGHARFSEAAARRVVVAGRALEHLPAVAAAFGAGRVTAEAVALLSQSPGRSTARPRPLPESTWPTWTSCWPTPPRRAR